MNPNQAFCFAFAILLRQIIDMQQQQIFAFFILYQRWVNEYIQILNVAFLRRKPWIRVAPYMWTIPSSAESWFDIHYLSSLLFLRPFVVLLSFFFCQTFSWPGAGRATDSPGASCEKIILHNNRHGGIIRVCMRIFTTALRNTTIRQILNENNPPYFHSVKIIHLTFTVYHLMKSTHFSELSISRFTTYIGLFLCTLKTSKWTTR